MVELSTTYDNAAHVTIERHATMREEVRRRTRKYGFEYMIIIAVVTVSSMALYRKIPSSVAYLRAIKSGSTTKVKRNHPIKIQGEGGVRGGGQAEIEDGNITNVTTASGLTFGETTNHSHQTTNTSLGQSSNNAYNMQKGILPSASLTAKPQFVSQDASAPIRLPPDDHGPPLPTPASGCCYSFDETGLAEIIDRFTPEYFVQQKKANPIHAWAYTGKEYEIWQNFLLKLLASNSSASGDTPLILSCQNQWRLMVLSSSKYHYLPLQINALGLQKGDWFPYSSDVKVGAPRILQLGDSISIGIWRQTIGMFSNLKLLNLHGAPGNCMGFENYENSLNDWLGNCTWDVVQFNVGQHYHPPSNDTEQEWREEYSNGLRQIVSGIRKHSPLAQVIFATTTPSPMDSKDTYPDKKTCKHFDKFHKPGFVSSMNQVARELAEHLNFTVNDRYAAIQGLLGKYQKPCNVHFETSGSRFLASHDWKFFLELLGLDS